MNQERGIIDAWNKKLQVVRGRIFYPILWLFNKLGLSANFITNFRLILGGIALLWFFSTDQISGPGILILVALLLDIFDGALARFQNNFSDRGKFLDVLNDNSIHAFIVLMCLQLVANNFLVAYQLFIIPVAYLLATIKKEEFNKSDWLIKAYPRLGYLKTIVVVPFFLAVFFKINYLNEVLWISNVWATLVAIYFYIFIQVRWQKVYPPHV